MPDVQVIDDEVPVSRGGASGGSRERSLSNRPVEDETIDLRGATTGRRRVSGRVSEDEDVRDRSARNPREAASLKALLDKHLPESDEGDGGENDPDAPRDEIEDETPAAEIGDGGEDDPDAPPDEDVVEPAGDETPEEPEVDERDQKIATLTEDYDRAIEQNRALVYALEDAEARAKAPREPSAIEKRLLEAVKHYDDRPVLAMRHFIAACIEAEKHDSDQVNQELSGVYIDLNAEELGVPLTETVKTQRESARIRNALARQKREEAAKTKPKETSDAVDHEGAHRHIEQELTTKDAEGKSLADEFPLLMTFAKQLEGKSPQEVLWQVMQRETKAGRFHARMKGDELLRAAAKFVETHYDNFFTAAEQARKKKQPTSTAKPNTSKANAGQDKRQQPGARTISNADAARAPARPPAKTSPKPQPKRTIDQVLDKHFGTKSRKK